MNRLERVSRALRFQKPDRVPMVYFNRDRERGDLVMVDIQNHFGGESGLVSEWGFEWERLDDTMGQPLVPMIRSWEADFPAFRAPAPEEEKRLAWIEAQKKQFPDQYWLASLQLSGFTTMSFLRGFAEIMEDFYVEPEYLHALAELVFGFETQLIRIAAKAGLHGVAFFDDWGTQNGLIISPALWKEFFKPRYAAQFACAHKLGMDVYFHCCGKIDPLIGELFEAGVDMLNLSQPNLFDLPRLGEQYGGKHCFVIPVSYQTTSITGTRADIFADVRTAVDCFGSCGGGLIGYIEEYSSMGMSEQNYQSCIDAFMQLGEYGKEDEDGENQGTDSAVSPAGPL